MIPSLVVDWGPELRPVILLLTLAALLPGLGAVAASLLVRVLRRRRDAARERSPAAPWHRAARLAAPAWMSVETAPVETARLSPRTARRTVRRHAKRRDPTP